MVDDGGIVQAAEDVGDWLWFGETDKQKEKRKTKEGDLNEKRKERWFSMFIYASFGLITLITVYKLI